MNNFLKRTLTGALFVIVLIAGILCSKYSFCILSLAILVLTLNEFYGLCKQAKAKPQRLTGIILGVFAFLLTFIVAQRIVDVKALFLFYAIVPLILIIELYRKEPHPIQNVALTVLGLTYIAIPVTLFIFIAFPLAPDQLVFHPEILLCLFILQWANDTGAYLLGSWLGKHRLFQRISPKKSWEGSAGGAIVALGISWIISFFIPQITLLHWLAIAIIIIIAGTFGDLAESLLKRSLGIKDSGNILPGHGGMLDRFDSILLATPIVFIYLKLFVFQSS